MEARRESNASYHIYNKDCLDVLKNMPDNSIDLIVTDPPYLTTSRGNSGNSGGMLQKDINKKGKVFTYNNINCKEYAPEFYRLLKDGSHCYVMTNHINLIDMLNTFTDVGFHFIKSLIWNKGNKIMGQYYMSQYEYILFFRKGKGKKINNCGTSDILSISMPMKLRLFLIQAIPVEPTPINGSNTSSFSCEELFTNTSINSMGFSVS